MLHVLKDGATHDGLKQIVGREYLEGKERAKYLRDNQIDSITGDDNRVLAKSRHAVTSAELKKILAVVIPSGEHKGKKLGDVPHYRETELLGITLANGKAAI